MLIAEDTNKRIFFHLKILISKEALNMTSKQIMEVLIWKNHSQDNLLSQKGKIYLEEIIDEILKNQNDEKIKVLKETITPKIIKIIQYIDEYYEKHGPTGIHGETNNMRVPIFELINEQYPKSADK